MTYLDQHLLSLNGTVGREKDGREFFFNLVSELLSAFQPRIVIGMV